MPTFKLIKSSPFEYEGAKFIAHVVGYHGRAINVNTMSFADNPEYKIDVSADKKTLSVTGGDISVVIKPYTDSATNATVNGLSLMPKFGLAIDAV